MGPERVQRECFRRCVGNLSSIQLVGFVRVPFFKIISHLPDGIEDRERNVAAGREEGSVRLGYRPYRELLEGWQFIFSPALDPAFTGVYQGFSPG